MPSEGSCCLMSNQAYRSTCFMIYAEMWQQPWWRGMSAHYNCVWWDECDRRSSSQNCSLLLRLPFARSVNKYLLKNVLPKLYSCFSAKSKHISLDSLFGAASWRVDWIVVSVNLISISLLFRLSRLCRAKLMWLLTKPVDGLFNEGSANKDDPRMLLEKDPDWPFFPKFHKFSFLPDFLMIFFRTFSKTLLAGASKYDFYEFWEIIWSSCSRKNSGN